MRYLREQNIRPEDKRKRFAWRLVHSVQRVSFVILMWCAAMAVLYFAYDVVFERSFFKLEKIEVKGDLNFTTETEIVGSLGIAEGTNLFSISLARLKDRVLMNDWVKEVAVRRDVPSGLIIFVKEYIPIAVARAGNGQWCFVGSGGTVFKEMDTKDKKDYPFISGLSDLPSCERGLRSAELDDALALKKLFAEGAIGSQFTISEMHLSKEAGVSIVTLKDGIVFKLGFAPFEPKLKRLNDMMGAILKGGRRLLYVDLNIPGKVAVRYEL